MNDRFKFRFWFYNNAYKKWYCINSDFITTDGSAIPYDDGEGGASTVYDRDYIAEQCTGLKDKNGKLIYEGDIVQMSYPYSSENKYIVKWGDCCWELWLENGFVYVIYEKMSQSMEVIGNIHENADLLEGKK